MSPLQGSSNLPGVLPRQSLSTEGLGAGPAKAGAFLLNSSQNVAARGNASQLAEQRAVMFDKSRAGERLALS